MSFVDTVFQWLPKLRRADGSLADAQSDAAGNLKVVIVGRADAETRWVDPEPGIPLTHARVVAPSGPRKLWRVVASNEGPAKRWLMVFDLAELPQPNAPCALAWALDPGARLDVDFARARTFLTGIAWAASAAANVYAPDAAAIVRVHAELG